MLPVRGRPGERDASPAGTVGQADLNADARDLAAKLRRRDCGRPRAAPWRARLRWASPPPSVSEFPHVAAAVSIDNGRGGGEKLPSVQKLPNHLVHPSAFHLSSPIERRSEFPESGKSFPRSSGHPSATGAAAAQSARGIPWVGASVSDQYEWQNSCRAVSRRKP